MRFLLGVLMLMISGSALATIDVLQFKDEAQDNSSVSSLKNCAARNARTTALPIPTR